MLRAATFAAMILLAGQASGQENGFWPASNFDAGQNARIRQVLSDVREDEVRAVIAAWYGELPKGGEGHASRLVAPMAILGVSSCNAFPDGTPVKHSVWPFTQELAYEALKFSYEVERLRIDENFARADVWERGWFYDAWSNKQTYENAASTTFILERGEQGEWKIAAFKSRNAAVRPDDADDPMPDMSGEFHRRFPERK